MRGIEGVAAHERRQRIGKGLEPVAGDARHGQSARIRDQRRGRPAFAQGMARAAARIGLAYRHQFVDAQGHVAKPSRRQLHRQRRMLIAAHQVDTALLQQRRHLLHHAGRQFHLRAVQQARGALAQPRYPVGHQGTRQAAAGADAQDALFLAASAAQLFAHPIDLLDDLAGRLQQGFALRRQHDRRAAALDQRRAGPGLQRADAPPEGRMRDVAQLGRAHEAAGLRQRDQVFEEFQVGHGKPPHKSLRRYNRLLIRHHAGPSRSRVLL
ncbi:Uncharacterised protein [Bordetella pertussis]|nr:Uncharacterised protein [Bordetella pertussis]